MTPVLSPKQFQQRMLDWFEVHGRKDLPWQQEKSPYHVWLSEIMLQQTQVTTVIPYFTRFIKRFPQLSSLANADLDEVLRYWAGLGYYARGRNLHRCAQIIEKEYGGKLPQQLHQLQKLPGIGRSTAGAILSLGFAQAAPILDGNVRRVLTRFHAIVGWPGTASIHKKLWKLAERYTPSTQIANYTQAIMDLGALVCTRSRPKCEQCPLQSHCLAYHRNNFVDFPSQKPTQALPRRSLQMLILINAKREILLEKRPPCGIWGGLWSLPECPIHEDAKIFSKKYYYCETGEPSKQAILQHTFSHFHLAIQPVRMLVTAWYPPLMESDRTVWYNEKWSEKKGLAAPVKKIVNQSIEALFS